MTTSKALVGPMKVQRFGPWRGGVRALYNPPKNTMDLRARLCVDHRVACDCREGLFAETISEYRAEVKALAEAAGRELRGHRLYDYGDETTPFNQRDHRLLHGDGPLACQCTGCRVVRAAGTYVHTDDAGVVQ